MSTNMKIIKEHTGVLLGSVETCECDPLMDCRECHGTGTCQECHGQGEVNCHTCHGNGKCTDCNGRGRWRCNECGGSGNCRRCHGTGDVQCSNCHGRGTVQYKDIEGHTGWKDCPKCGGSGNTPCPECRSGMQSAAKFLDEVTFGAGRTYGHGSGKCSKCDGTGEIVCKTCNGTGDCKTCHGSGQLTCEHCHGSGDCPRCDHGKVTCERCDGSGNYQTFIRRKTTLYAKDWRFSGSTPYKDIVGASYGSILHDGPVKTWKDATQVESDVVDKTNKECEQSLGEEKELYEEFLESYRDQRELVTPNNDSDKPYARNLKVQKVPVTKINYSLNGENYEVLVVGDNHIVAVKSIPTVIKGFELTKWQKIKLAMTEKSRLKAFARLAAYIFQCDGKSQEESAVLDSMISALKLNASKESAFRKELDGLNSNLPYDKVRKMIKPLLKSKKTITFTWQCMAVDKMVTPDEEKLFSNIVSEYKIDSKEVEHLKGLAQKFAKLKKDQFAIEYADLSDEFAAIRKKVWKTILFSIMGVVVVASIVVYMLMPKTPHNSSSDYNSLEEIYDSIEKVKSEAILEINGIGKNEKLSDDVESNELETEEVFDNIVSDNQEINGNYPEASERLLTDSDLASMDKTSLRYMRNEIYARHGYIFKNQELREHFEHEFWYEGLYSDVSSMLTDVEKKNVALIQKYENK
ncbi:MAG: YARHG domain-containing protein [Bacteroidaceae bacterium]|nr:YARHG domain-containing protein [Bacteroidaceae bacterium]